MNLSFLTCYCKRILVQPVTQGSSSIRLPHVNWWLPFPTLPSRERSKTKSSLTFYLIAEVRCCSTFTYMNVKHWTIADDFLIVCHGGSTLLYEHKCFKRSDSSLRIKAKLSLEKETPNAFFISWKKGRRLQSVKKESSTSLGLQLSFSRERRVAEAFLEEVVFWLWSVTSYALRYYYRSSTVGKLLLVQDMHSTPSRGHQSFRKHSRRGGISANQRLSFSSSSRSSSSPKTFIPLHI